MILNKAGIIADKYWREIPSHFTSIKMYDFVIMPNHIHGIIQINEDIDYSKVIETEFESDERYRLIMSNNDLIHTVINSYKAIVTKEIHKLYPEMKFSWQTSMFEMIIKDESELNNIKTYIKTNPALWKKDFENREHKKKLTDKEEAQKRFEYYAALSANVKNILPSKN